MKVRIKQDKEAINKRFRECSEFKNGANYKSTDCLRNKICGDSVHTSGIDNSYLRDKLQD